MAWKKILCGVDFSPCSRTAAEMAAALAARDEATLTLLHVYPVPRSRMMATELLAPLPPASEAEVLRELEGPVSELRATAEAIAGARRVAVQLVSGKAADQLARAARDGGHDLLVVGSHGRTGVRRLALGSVAEHAVRAVPCSVLVVRGPDPLRLACEPD
jgi:nucleotide-binding universal stress UspA family protein